MENFEIIFETERIYFVKISKKLVKDYLIMVNNIEVQKYISHKIKKYTLEQELEWIKNKLSTNSIIFSMIEKENNEFIGNIEIMKIINNIGEIGISITSKKQNKHFGQEAIKGFINYSFSNLNLKGLELNVYKSNLRGIHCYEKVGFKVIGEGKTSEDIHMKLIN
ncbi:MAG: GNAT family N-acetyltransferase [Firmicutes bacterium]|nr:GNAT family N-acetyltransferase [Bacillota bacterium]